MDYLGTLKVNHVYIEDEELGYIFSRLGIV